MHTIERMVVIYTTQGIMGYLLLWKYSCFISGTENRSTFVICLNAKVGNFKQQHVEKSDKTKVLQLPLPYITFRKIGSIKNTNLFC